MKLSIVTTLYKSKKTIDEFYRRVIATAEAITPDFELIMVNDGSPDDSLEMAVAIQQNDPRVTVVDLARNFGHHKAMMTGLAYAGGEMVFLIDSDLEEEPEILPQFYERFAAGDCDVVYGVQAARRGGIVERFSGELFFFLAGLLSDHPMPRNLVTARLMRRNYVRTLVRHRDREFVIADLWRLSGFRQVPILIDKLSHSPTNYSFRRKIEMAVRYITTTSTKLLYIILYFGLIMFLFSSAVIIYYIIRYFASGIGVNGFTSIIVSIWFLGGTTMLILGIIGIYIANILAESKRRPYTVVRDVHRNHDSAAVGGNRIDKSGRRHNHEGGMSS